jgi:hypothetical protein
VSPGGSGLCVVIALTALSAAGAVKAAVMRHRRPDLPGAVFLVLGVSLSLGAWALVGWAWVLAGGAVR